MRSVLAALLASLTACGGGGGGNVPPEAVDDVYAAIGHVLLTQLAAAGLLVNDTPAGSVSVTNFDAQSTQGGDVDVAADGGFTYNPPVGFEGVDTFTYEVTAGGATSTATVTVNVTDVVWFIDNTAAPGGDGRFTSRFQTAAEFNAVQGAAGPDDPETGDYIFLFNGNGAAYDGGIDLLDDQKLIGEGVDLVVTSTTVVPAGTAPELTATVGNGVNLASANRVAGLVIDSTQLTGICADDVAGPTLFESLTIRNAGDDGIELQDCTGTFTFTDVDISGSADDGIDVNSSTAALDFTSGSLQSGSGSLLNVRNGHTGSVQIATGVQVGATGGTGLRFFNADGTYTLSSSVTLNGGDAGIDIIGGSEGTFTFASVDVTNSTGLAVNIDGDVAGQAADVTFDNLIVRQSVGHGVFVNKSGRLSIGAFGSSVNNIENTTGDGIHVVNTNLSLNFVHVGPNLAVGDDGIQVTNNDGASRTAEIINTNVFPVPPAADTIPGRGIFLDAQAGTLDATLTSNFLECADHTIASIDGGAERSLILDMAGNSTLTTTTSGVPTMEFVGSGLHSTIVTAWQQPNQVIGAVAADRGGGVFFNRITFDADGNPSNGSQLVQYSGTLEIGKPTARVLGDGLVFINPTGSLSIGRLDIANSNGTGLFIDAKGLGTSFDLMSLDGTVDTDGGASQFLDPPPGAPPLRLNLAFDRVSSRGSATHGIIVDNARGTIRIGKLDVIDAKKGAVEIRNSPDLKWERKK